MKQSFKKYFIPHEENDHAPHFLRTKSMVFVVGMIFAAEALFLLNKFALLNTNLFALIFPDVLVAQTNENRELNSLSDLSANSVLQLAAELKAKDMAAKGYFAHTSPEGVTPWHWFDEAGYKYAYAGENLAINFVDSVDVTNAWMNSPLHRANILNNRFTEIGIATAKGMYQGRETVFVVQMFGKPLAVAVAPAQIPTPTPAPPPIAVPAPQPTPTPTVSGASDAPIEQSEVFVAVEGAETEPEIFESPIAKGESEIKIPAPLAIVENALSSPRQNANALLFLIASVVAAALVLKVFIRIRIQKPKLIASGVMVIALAVLAILINEKISLTLASIV